MEVKSRTLRTLALALGCALLLTAAPAHADKPKPADLAEARTRYKKGLDLYQEGAFDAALIELQRAYELAPSFKILYNVALVDMQLNDYAGALKNFRQYLEDGGKKVDGKRRAEVEKEIEKCVARVANVTVKSNVNGAEVLVDDLKVGETPLDKPLLVNSGKRKISLNKDGYVAVSRVVVVAGGDEKTLELELRTPAEARAQAGKKPEAGGGQQSGTAEPPGRPVPWLWWGITGGLAAGTTVAGLLTLGAESDLDKKKQHPATKQELDDAASKTRTFAIVTDVFLVGTLAVGGYATYLTFFDDETTDPEADEKKAAWGLAVGPTSISVAGTF